MEYIKLDNGLELPQIGLGTWQITDRKQMAEVIFNAYNAGYQMIDTAAAYSNEIAIAKAIGAAGIKREELFLSDKVWNTCRGYAAVQEACRKSLKKLKTEYLDLYLIHWPASMKVHADWKEINADTWRGMEKIYEEGLVRAIGVCNFKEHHLLELEKTARIEPMVDQIELHPGLEQKKLLQYCKEKNIAVEASSPLGNGQILNNDNLIKIANEKGKSVAQICLRWEIQKGIIVIPKTVNKGRLCENMEIFDFELDDREMSVIDSIPYCGGIGIDSDEVIDFE